MGFWKRFKKHNSQTNLGYYIEAFGQPDLIYECNWLGGTVRQVQLTNVQVKKNGFYVFQFPARDDRPLWTYITLGMSDKTMVNGLKAELIWLNESKDIEIADLMIGLSQYVFAAGVSYDYGQTISNSEAVSPFIMNTLLICPPIIEAAESANLMDYLEKHNTDLLWLLPIHPSEKEFIQNNGGYISFFDLWQDKDLSANFLCDPNRPPII